MIVSVYAHPYQTLVAYWQRHGSSLELVEFREVAPVDTTLDHAFDGLPVFPVQSSLKIIVPTRDVSYIRYPVDADELPADRRAFELQTCLPEAAQQPSLMHDFDLPELIHGNQWHGIVAINPFVADKWKQRFPGATVLSDITCDVNVFRKMEPRSESNTALLVNKGTSWWCAIKDEENTLRHLAQLPHADVSYESCLYDIIEDHNAVIQTPIRKIIVAGDNLRADILTAVSESMKAIGISVQRMMPFGMVQSSLPNDVAQRCLRMSHVLSPLVGSVIA